MRQEGKGNRLNERKHSLNLLICSWILAFLYHIFLENELVVTALTAVIKARGYGLKDQISSARRL